MCRMIGEIYEGEGGIKLRSKKAIITSNAIFKSWLLIHQEFHTFGWFMTLASFLVEGDKISAIQPDLEETA